MPDNHSASSVAIVPQIHIRCQLKLSSPTGGTSGSSDGPTLGGL